MKGKNRWWRKFEFWLIILSVLRILYVFCQTIGADKIKWLPYQFHTRALGLINGTPINYSDAVGSFYIILAGIYRLIDVFGLSAVRITIFTIFQAILGSLSVYLFYLIAKKLFDKKVAVVGSIIFAFYYPLIYLHTMILSESLFTFLLILFVYLCLKDNLKATGYLLLGITIGLLLVCRANFLTFLPFWVIWFGKRLRKEKESRWLLGGVIFSIIVEILLVIAFINYVHSGLRRFSISGNTSVMLAVTECHIKKISYVLGTGENYWFSPPAYWNRSDLREMKTNVPFYNQFYYFQMALNCLKQNPRLVINNLGNITNMYHGAFYPEIFLPPYHRSLIFTWKIITIVFTFLFFIFPFFAHKREKQNYWFFFFLIISLYLAVYIANPGEERYLVPYFFIFLLYALPTMQRIFYKIFSSR